MAAKPFIEKIAKDLLSRHTDLGLPVRVEEIALREGLKILPYELGEDVSGVLIIENNQVVIGYNQTESRVRRRFTIAHELGHYFLHRDKSSLFVDKVFRAYRSNLQSDPEVQKLEQEANAFAAAILMPSQYIKKEIDKNNIDFGTEEEITDLAKIFDVSTTAMHFRLTNLGYLLM